MINLGELKCSLRALYCVVVHANLQILKYKCNKKNQCVKTSNKLVLSNTNKNHNMDNKNMDNSNMNNYKMNNNSFNNMMSTIAQAQRRQERGGWARSLYLYCFGNSHFSNSLKLLFKATDSSAILETVWWLCSSWWIKIYTPKDFAEVSVVGFCVGGGRGRDRVASQNFSVGLHYFENDTSCLLYETMLGAILWRHVGTLWS